MPPKGQSSKSKKSSSTKATPKVQPKAAQVQAKTASSARNKASVGRALTPKKPATSKGIALKKQTAKRTAKSSSNEGKSPLEIGAPAPAFSLPDDTGRVVNLSDFLGKKVVLFFYPKDDTPGCTKEACAFRDGIQDIRQRGAVILGVSADSVGSHRKFSDKFQLNFPLLSDESKVILQSYGVWKEKSLYGRKFMGIERTTVLINEDGSVGRIFPKVKVDGHVTQVMEALRA